MKIQVVIEATSIKEYTQAIQALAAGYTVEMPQPIINVTASSKAAETVENDVAEESKSVETEVKYISTKSAKRLDDKIKGLDVETLESLFAEFNIASVVGLPENDLRKFDAALNKALKEDKPSEDAAAPKTEEKAADEAPEAPKHGFPAVKAIAMKLSKIQDGKAEVKFLLDKFGAAKLSELQEKNYDEFHALASKAISDHDNAPSNDSVSESNGKSKETVETNESKTEDSGEKEVTLPMIRGIAKQLADQGFKDEIRQVLKDHEAASLTKINKKDYQSVYDALVAYNG